MSLISYIQRDIKMHISCNCSEIKDICRECCNNEEKSMRCSTWYNTCPKGSSSWLFMNTQIDTHIGGYYESYLLHNKYHIPFIMTIIFLLQSPPYSHHDKNSKHYIPFIITLIFCPEINPMVTLETWNFCS